MNKLELPVNKFFFNQVLDGSLQEDFRAIKPYWIKKLIKRKYQKLEPIELVREYLNGSDIFKKYDKILFKNGYSSNSPTKELYFGGLRFTHPEEMTCMGRGVAFAIKVNYI